MTNKALRVSIVSETFPPEINGVAMTVSQLLAQLGRRGHQVQLVRPRQPQEGLAPSGASETLLVRGMPIPGYRELRFGLPAIRRLRQSWRELRPDVIYVATEGPLGWAAVKVAERLGIPVVSGFHTQFHHYSSYYRLGGLQSLVFRYLKSLHNRTACTLVPTEAMRQAMEQDICAIEVLGRGIDCEHFNPAKRSEALRREWGAGPADKVFLYVGRLAREKNIDLALNTFLKLKQNHPGIRMVLVGPGPDYSRLYDRHEGLVFVGSKVGDELARHYASADIFLFPSLSETFGNVVLEAMASGLACVAFNDAAAAIHIDHGYSGMLAEPDDEAAFLRHSQTLLANDRFLRSLQREARHSMEGMAWEEVGAEFERILMDYAERRVGDESGERFAADFSR